MLLNRPALLLALFWLLCPPTLSAASPAGATTQQQPRLVVYAAIAMKNIINESAALYRQREQVDFDITLGTSAELAKRLDKGEKADLFLSTSVRWMDELEDEDLLAAGTRRDLLRNRLVLIAPAQSRAASLDALGKDTDLGGLLGEGGKLAMADPDDNPGGRAGKEALEWTGLWPSVKRRILPAAKVRDVLGLVAGGDAPLGLVYQTDAPASKEVRVIGVFPLESHAPIIYPAAALAGGDVERAARFLDFLSGPEVLEIYRKYGFEPAKR